LKRILFVDDESKILDGIRRMLHGDRKRWDMHFAGSGEDALIACEKGVFDIVISDMRMPGMDGATLLAHVRDRFPSSARIVLSGYSEAALAARAIPLAHRFLTKPCVAAELQSTIERVCGLQDLLSTPETRDIVGMVGELPSLSTTYISLTKAVEEPEITTRRVADIIGNDLAMSAKILQLVNSAFFGLGQKVTNLQTAVSFLGIGTIKNLACATEAFRAFVPDARIPQAACESMQQHAQRTAAVASALVANSKIRDVTVLAALLHDIGSLILASKAPDKFCAAAALATERGCKGFEAEKELFGTTHAEIGAYLLGLWGIPELSIEAIAHHHHPTRIPHTDFDATTAVYIADLLSEKLETRQGSAKIEIEESERACLESLGVLSRFPDFCDLAIQCKSQ
jgi:HD-like signal output (HDOD) protein